MTYRQDSDIVHDYGRYIPRRLSSDVRDRQLADFYLSPKDNRSTYNVTNEFRTRRNRILWFVSNCKTRTLRHKIANELRQLYPMDEYGQCSSSKKSAGRASTETFEKLLFQYKFYLAFENSDCQDYVTEKAFYNALAHGSIPIVLRPSRDNYRRILPPKSFIHVDEFKGLNELAVELKRIAEMTDVFESYHQWRLDYRLITWPSNYFVNDRFCDLCRKLHQDHTSKTYNNFSSWLNQCR